MRCVDAKEIRTVDCLVDLSTIADAAAKSQVAYRQTSWTWNMWIVKMLLMNRCGGMGACTVKGRRCWPRLGMQAAATGRDGTRVDDRSSLMQTLSFYHLSHHRTNIRDPAIMGYVSFLNGVVV